MLSAGGEGGAKLADQARHSNLPGAAIGSDLESPRAPAAVSRKRW
jgi:hypothetical protein